jgi:hypothetical protein
MQKSARAAILSVFLLVTLILIPWQWLLLKLMLPGASSFPHAITALCPLFGIRITRDRRTGAMKKLFIKTYGCQMNVYDSARMADLLAPLGYAQTTTPRMPTW